MKSFISAGLWQEESKDIKNDSGSTIGMNLNGNSVVICTSKNATEQIPYINIYEDKNQNGIVAETIRQMRKKSL